MIFVVVQFFVKLHSNAASLDIFAFFSHQIAAYSGLHMLQAPSS